MKVPRLLTFLLAAAALAACQKEELTGPEYNTDAVAFDGIATFAASGSSEEAFDLLWEADVDRIGLFTFTDGQAGQTNVYYAATSTGTGSVKFMSPSLDKGIEWDASSTARHDVYAYYPYRASHNDCKAIPVSVAAEQKGAPGDSKSVKGNLSLYASATDVASSAGNVPLGFTGTAAVIRLDITSSVPVPSVKKLTLSASQGVALAFGEGSLDLTDGTVTIDPAVSPSNVIEYTFSEPVAIYDTPVSVYIVTNPVAAGMPDMTLTAEYGADSRVLTLGNLTVPDAGIRAGTVTTYPVAFEYDGAQGYEDAIDLSANGTANTYIVSKAGAKYRFNATVKGNGIPRTFTWTESDGTEITRSYSDLDITPANVRLVWYNSPMTSDGYSDKSPVVLSSVLYELGTVYFSTPEPFVSGNVLLAAYNDSGEILWSWNIWAAEGYDPESTAIKAGRYSLMDRNIGAVSGPEVRNADRRTAARAIGNYYQWGRKDPFPAAAEYIDKGLDGAGEMYWGIPTHTPIEEYQQDYSSKSWGAADLIFGSVNADNAHELPSVLGNSYSVDQAVEESIKYPFRWMASSGSDNWNDNYNWTRSSGLNGTANASVWHYLWGCPAVAPEYMTDESDNLKTIYDPCPAGWKVAPAEALAFAASAAVKLEYGYWNERTGFYSPLTGQRQGAFSNGGTIQSLVGDIAWIHSGNVGYDGNGKDCPVKLDNTGTSAFNSYTGAGYNVRCVKEEPGSLSLSHAGPACVLLGDSITQVWMSRTDNKTFDTDNNLLMKGISGETSAKVADRLFSDVIANDPQCVHIMCGINDMANNDNADRTDEGIFNNIKEMAKQAASWGIKVMIGSTPPSNYIGWHDAAWNEANDVSQRVVNLNNMLKVYCEEMGFIYVDYYSALVDDEGGLKKEYQVDSVHPNNAGYAVMEPLFLEALARAREIPGASDQGGNIHDFDKENW